MASFTGTSFSERGDSGSRFPAWSGEATINQILIPGGAPVLQGGGRSAQTLDMPIQCSTTQYGSLRGKIGTSGSLVIAYGTFTAVFVGISGAIQVVDGADIWQMTLKFLRVG